MAKFFKARCLRDTVQDNPYMYYRAGEEYTISEDSVVRIHFEPLEELSKAQADRHVAENPTPPKPESKVVPAESSVKWPEKTEAKDEVERPLPMHPASVAGGPPLPEPKPKPRKTAAKK